MLDLTLVILGALVWLPVLLAASLMVLMAEGRPVYYTSNRRVSSDLVMRVVKFRTMVRNAEAIVNRTTVPVTDQVRFLNMVRREGLRKDTGRRRDIGSGGSDNLRHAPTVGGPAPRLREWRRVAVSRRRVAPSCATRGSDGSGRFRVWALQPERAPPGSGDP